MFVIAALDGQFSPFLMEQFNCFNTCENTATSDLHTLL